MFFSLRVEALPSCAFLHFFQASGVRRAVFACTSVSEGIWRDLQLLTTEILQRVFHFLCRLRLREGKEELSFASCVFEQLQNGKQEVLACQV